MAADDKTEATTTEQYEPPRIWDLGSVHELTAGTRKSKFNIDAHTSS
jgi:hypothetical protein